MKKLTAVICITVALLAGCSLAPTESNAEPSLPNVTTPEVKLPITPEPRAQLREGMTIEEVREILGYSGKDIASGTIIYVYEMTTGESFEVCFIGSRDGFIVTGIHTIEE